MDEDGTTDTGGDDAAWVAKAVAEMQAASADEAAEEPAAVEEEPTSAPLPKIEAAAELPKRLPADYAAGRAEKRARQLEQAAEAKAEALARREAQFEARVQTAEATSPERIKTLMSERDFDGAAKAFGWDKWDDMIKYSVESFNDPGYKDRRKLEGEVSALREERQREKAERETAQATERQRAAEANYVNDLQATLLAAEDVTIKSLADTPRFVPAVWNRIRTHYLETGEELTAEDAAADVVKTAREQYDILHKVFSGQPAVQQAEASIAKAVGASPDRAGRQQQPARKTHVTRNRAAEAAAPTGTLSDKEWAAMALKEMQAAQLEEERLKAG